MQFMLMVWLLIVAAPTSYAAADNSGRNSHFWFTLRAAAGTAAAVNTDLVLRNGYRSVDLSSPELSCTRVSVGSNWLYRITWTGNTFFGDAAAETLEFSVLVEAFKGATFVYSAPKRSSITDLGSVTIPTDKKSNWGVDGDNDIDEGESLRMTLQDIKVNGVAPSSNGLLLAEKAFTSIKEVETNGGNSHKLIFGVGTGLTSKSFSTPTSVDDVSGETFSVTGAGSSTASAQWAIEYVEGMMIVRNPALTVEDPARPFTDLSDGHTFGKNTPYPPTTAAKLANAFPKFSWSRVPRTMLIRKAGVKFTTEEVQRIAQRYDIVVLEKANGSLQGYHQKSSALEAVNPHIKTVMYWNSRIYFGHYDIDNSILVPANWAAWIDPTFVIRDGLDTYQQSNPDFINWWVGSCHKAMGLIPGTSSNGIPFQPSPVDGVFIDKTGFPTPMAQPLYEGSPDNKFIMCNNGDGARARINYLDGTYREDWNEGMKPEAIVRAMALVEESATNNKLTMLRNPVHGASTKRDMEDRVDDVLAIYLASAGPYAYFYYANTVDASEAMHLWLVDYLDQFTRPLGAPLGPAIRDSWVLARSFERCDVYLNLKASTGVLPRILWKNNVGAPALAGSGFSKTDGSYTLKGSGNISGTADNFFYLSDLHYGDGEIVGSINSLSNTNPNAKAGFMFRERSEPANLDDPEDCFVQYTNGNVIRPAPCTCIIGIPWAVPCSARAT